MGDGVQSIVLQRMLSLIVEDKRHWRPSGLYWSYQTGPIITAERLAKAEAYGFAVALYLSQTMRSPNDVSPNLIMALIMDQKYIHDVNFVAKFDHMLALGLEPWQHFSYSDSIPSLDSSICTSWAEVMDCMVSRFLYMSMYFDLIKPAIQLGVVPDKRSPDVHNQLTRLFQSKAMFGDANIFEHPEMEAFQKGFRSVSCNGCAFHLV